MSCFHGYAVYFASFLLFFYFLCCFLMFPDGELNFTYHEWLMFSRLHCLDTFAPSR